MMKMFSGAMLVAGLMAFPCRSFGAGEATAVPAAVTSSPTQALVVPLPSSDRSLPARREPRGRPTVYPDQPRAADAGPAWSVKSETNALQLAAIPVPTNDVQAVRALREQVRATLSALARHEVDMQVAGGDQMKRARNYRTKLRTEDPELLKLQERLAALDNERATVARQLEERFSKDPQYQKLTQERTDGLKTLRDMGALSEVLREKLTQLDQQEAAMVRQAALSATNQVKAVQGAPGAAPAVIIKQ